MARTKGAAVINRITILKEHYGEDVYEEILEKMKPENREQLSNMLFSSWYDANLFMDLNICTAKTLGKKHPDISVKIGELTADSSLKGIYSSKLKENNVAETLKRVPSIWNAFHDGGEFNIEVKEGNRVEMTVRGYPLPHEEFCANLLGWSRRLLELSGGRQVEVKHTKCVCKGDNECLFVSTWK